MLVVEIAYNVQVDELERKHEALQSEHVRLRAEKNEEFLLIPTEAEESIIELKVGGVLLVAVEGGRCAQLVWFTPWTRRWLGVATETKDFKDQLLIRCSWSH